MPDITSPQAVRFANDRVRIMADAIESLIETARRYLNEYTAIGGNALFPDDASVVLDGAASDGRKIMTGAMVRSVNARAYELLTDYTANAEAKLATVRQVSVSSQPRF